MTKHCPKCDRELPKTSFNVCKTKKSGLQSWCKECKSENSKVRLLRDDVKEANRQKSAQARANNPEKIKQNVARYKENLKNNPEKQEKVKKKKLDYHYQSEYGLTYQQVEDMKMAQGYRCAICETIFLSTKDAHVDHSHTTGKVRQILCSSCNLGIGKFKESKETLQKAIEYLERHSGGE